MSWVPELMLRLSPGQYVSPQAHPYMVCSEQRVGGCLDSTGSDQGPEGPFGSREGR